jgi:hypothetical protein
MKIREMMLVKTDRMDARGIAQLIRMGWLRAVHAKSASSEEIRALLTARIAAPQAAGCGTELARRREAFEVSKASRARSLAEMEPRREWGRHGETDCR